MKDRRKSQSGIVTMELLIALSIIILTLTSATLLTFGVQSNLVTAQNYQRSIYETKKLIEDARARARVNFLSLRTIPEGDFEIYKKNLFVYPEGEFEKRILGTLDWAGGSVSLRTALTDWNKGKCNIDLSKNWREPKEYAYADLSSPNSGTGIAIKDKVAFLTSDPSSAPLYDFYAFDISSVFYGKGELPVLKSFSTGLGLTDVKISGNFAYASAHSALNQLVIIDVGDPTKLGDRGVKSSLDVTEVGDSAYGNTLFFNSDKIYLGLTKSNGPEFYIIDVTDPASPSVINGSEFEVDGAVNSIFVENNTAYIATASTSQLLTLNIENPSSVRLIDKYSSSALTGQSIAKNNNIIYFGRIGGSGNPKLFSFSDNNLNSPLWNMNMGSQSGIYNMFFYNNLLFMNNSDPNDGFQIWDIAGADVETAPVRFDTENLNIEQGQPTGILCNEGLLFVAQNGERGLTVIGPNPIQ